MQKKGEFFRQKVTPKNVEISTVSAKRVKKVILFKLKKIFCKVVYIMDFKNTHLSHPGKGRKPAKPVIAMGTAFQKKVKKSHPTITQAKRGV